MGEAPRGGQGPFYLIAWADCPALLAALAAAPCGCELARRAATDPDPEARAVWANDAPPAQARWACPCATHRPPPASADALDAGCRGALDRVAALTGAEGLATCPLYYTRGEVPREVFALRRWRDAGQLQLRVAEPSAALCDAIDAIDEGLERRMAYDRDHPPPPPATPAGADTPDALDD